jgi:hypothetical protein
MVDPEKTNNLRRRLDAIKPVSNEETIHEEDNHEVAQKAKTGWITLGVIIWKNAAFWGAQYLILNKAHIQPFLWWESIFVFAGITAVISQFKK